DGQGEAAHPGNLRDVPEIEEDADRPGDQKAPVVGGIVPQGRVQVRLERLVEHDADVVSERDPREDVLGESEDGIVLVEEGQDGEREKGRDPGRDSGSHDVPPPPEARRRLCTMKKTLPSRMKAT